MITIDGPSAVGKTTVARRVAEELGLTHLDTGAMYRALTWSLLDRGLPIEEEAALSHLEGLEIAFSDDQVNRRVLVNGRDVTSEIRTPRVDESVSGVAEMPAVRAVMVARQRVARFKRGLVVEGRDAGTAIFPAAEVKVFLTASLEERARRRRDDFKAAKREVSADEVGRELERRDRIDSSRAADPLSKAADAHEINTTARSLAEVIEEVTALARAAAKEAPAGSA